MVFLGFTGASSVGLLIGQRNLLANCWTSWDYQPTATYYAEENDNRQHEGVDRALIVNTTSLGLESPWMEKLSELTQGYYNQIDKVSLTETQDDVS